jgi:DNA-nicking Smr family endonuclease
MTRSRDPGPAPSDTEDAALWQKAMADVKPLRRRRPRKRRAGSAEPPQAAPSNAATTTRPAAPVQPPPAKPPAGPRAQPGTGIDRATLARLKRGDIPISGRLDLHGMTQADAHAALDGFIGRAASAGKRLLLVITGKGSDGDGVLRRMLPRWINSGPHAARVLRIEPAHARHGGGGAWYVYLRRDRARDGSGA